MNAKSDNLASDVFAEGCPIDGEVGVNDEKADQQYWEDLRDWSNEEDVKPDHLKPDPGDETDDDKDDCESSDSIENGNDTEESPRGEVERRNDRHQGLRLEKVFWRRKPHGIFGTSLLDLCEFECLWCNKFESKTYSRLLTHFKEQHKNEITTYRLFHDHEAYAKKLVLYHCQYCPTTLPHDKELIIHHIFRRRSKCKLNKHLETGGNAFKSGKDIRGCRVRIKLTRYVQHCKDEMLRKTVPNAAVSMERYSYNQNPPKNLGCEGETPEIANLCRIKCAHCEKTFSNWVDMRNHQMKTKHPQCAFEELRFHRCRICQMLVKCDVHIIRRHLAEKHPTTTFTAYLFTKPKTFPTERIHQANYPFEGRTASEREMKKVALPKELLTDKIEACCKFQCDQCRTITYNWHEMLSHMRKTNHGERRFDKKYVKEFKIFRCKLCPALVLCDGQVVLKHILTKHNLNGTSYKNAARESSPCREERTIPHVTNPLPKQNNPPMSLPDNLTTAEIDDLCEFACQHCVFESKKLSTMMSHLRKGLHVGVSARFNPRMLRVARYHKCKICSSVLLCDVTVIKAHLSNQHSISVESYNRGIHDARKVCCRDDEIKDEEKRKSVKSLSAKFARASHTKKNYVANSGVEIPAESTTNHFGNLCTFKCSECRTFFAKTWESLCRHRTGCKHPTYKRDIAASRMMFHIRYVLEARYHGCLFCRKLMLCDTELIRRHLKVFHHACAHEDYQRRSREVEGSPQFKKVFEELPSYVTPQMIVEDVTNKCIFQCEECHEKLSRWLNFCSHRRHYHGILKRGRFEPKIVSHAAYHACKVCHKFILCDGTSS